jgi:hypothetical protein
MWDEDGAGHGSVVYFYAISILEASLLFVLEATTGHMVLFSL